MDRSNLITTIDKINLKKEKENFHLKWQEASKIRVYTKWDPHPQTLSTNNQNVKIKGQVQII